MNEGPICELCRHPFKADDSRVPVDRVAKGAFGDAHLGCLTEYFGEKEGV